MAQKMSLNLKQSQSLLMTPQLQQAIKMLTLTHMEMTSVIAKEMMENPMLEETGAESTTKEVEARHNETNEVQSGDFSEPKLIDSSKDNFDWEKYIENYNSTSSTPHTKEVRSRDDSLNYENMVSKGQNLQEHLEWQLRMENLTEQEWPFAYSVIHNLNDEGYLLEDLDALIKSSELVEEDALEILKMIQSLEPIGCAARNLRECLLIQAELLLPRTPLVELLIKDHLEDLIKNDLKKIENATGIAANVIKEAELILHSLNPKPGRLINPDDVQYVVPDIYIADIGGELTVKLNNEGVPRLRVSNLYKNLINESKKNDETSEYVQEKLRAALWLIKSIDNRQKTIEKVAHAIIRYQPEFFKKGAVALKPMILKDIANEISVHESTVSRVTTNKFVHTPLGIFELKFFFNTGIGGKNGGIDIASESLKVKIKELVDHEDDKRPLSDQKIADILSKSDIKVARRTVAKYRENLNILPSSKRKKVS